MIRKCFMYEWKRAFFCRVQMSSVFRVWSDRSEICKLPTCNGHMEITNACMPRTETSSEASVASPRHVSCRSTTSTCPALYRTYGTRPRSNVQTQCQWRRPAASSRRTPAEDSSPSTRSDVAGCRVATVAVVCSIERYARLRVLENKTKLILQFVSFALWVRALSFQRLRCQRMNSPIFLNRMKSVACIAQGYWTDF